MPLQTDREKGAHLLRRFGLGASEAELDYYLKDGLNGAVDRLTEYESIDEGFSINPFDLQPEKAKNLPMPIVTAWWIARMISTRRPLQEKMTLFWHDHFATSASKVKASEMMLQQNETLRQYATGNFRSLLTNVSKDPAMLFWLDNQENVRGKPNENFAREVMELFTLGVGNYSEKDVQEAARAFTGWSVARSRRNVSDGQPPKAEFLFRPRLHDSSMKVVLGKSGQLTGEDVLNHLCDMPRTAEYISEKLLTWFAYPEPEPAFVKRIAKVFRDSNLDIKTTLKAIMRSSEFYSDKAERAIVKTPVDFVVPTMRQLGFGPIMRETVSRGVDNRLALLPAASAGTTMKNMGMQLLYPPDVAGWEGGEGWISSATMVERIGWSASLFGTGKGRRLGNGYPYEALFNGASTPTEIVDRLTSLFDAKVNPERKKILVANAEKELTGPMSRAMAQKVGSSVTRLMFATPEFQFA